MQLPNKPQGWYQQNLASIAGVDEAGRGPLAGPVVAACVVLNPNAPILDLDDSKKLSEKRRLVLFHEISRLALGVGIGIVSPAQIDEMNILRASLLAMKISFDDLVSKSVLVSTVLVDGNQKAPITGNIEQITVIGGDGLFSTIMAASIIAKVTRDRMMSEMDSLYPGYGFAKNKGYGTREHLQALSEIGPCAIHRKSFAPVRQESFRDAGWNA